MKKILSTILILIFVVILTINIMSALGTSFFGIRIYRVGSGSMEPNIHVNDLIIIKKSNNYKVNDVVTYKDGNDFVTHRIVSISKDQIVTKGDANNVEDKPIKEGSIVGKMIYRFKHVGIFDYFFNRKSSLILVFVIGIFITIMIPDKNKRYK